MARAKRMALAKHPIFAYSIVHKPKKVGVCTQT